MVTENDELDYMLTANLLDAFGCDSSKKAYYDFVELVYKIRLEMRKNPKIEPPTAEIVAEMCKARRQPRRGFYGNIRRCIAPLLAADEDFWLTLGGKIPEKMTVGGVAKYLARIFENS